VITIGCLTGATILGIVGTIVGGILGAVVCLGPVLAGGLLLVAAPVLLLGLPLVAAPVLLGGLAVAGAPLLLCGLAMGPLLCCASLAIPFIPCLPVLAIPCGEATEGMFVGLGDMMSGFCGTLAI
jgi:hypothetical protein